MDALSGWERFRRREDSPVPEVIPHSITPYGADHNFGVSVLFESRELFYARDGDNYKPISEVQVKDSKIRDWGVRLHNHYYGPTQRLLRKLRISKPREVVIYPG